jgi:hypothetical protein
MIRSRSQVSPAHQLVYSQVLAGVRRNWASDSWPVPERHCDYGCTTRADGRGEAGVQIQVCNDLSLGESCWVLEQDGKLMIWSLNSGKESTVVHYTETTGSGENQQTHRRTARGSHKLVEIEQALEKFVGGFVPVKHFSLPFSIELPDGLPPSMQIGRSMPFRVVRKWVSVEWLGGEVRRHKEIERGEAQSQRYRSCSHVHNPLTFMALAYQILAVLSVTR